MWIARDKSGDLYLYETKPIKKDDFGWVSSNGVFQLLVECDWFPEVKWSDNEPRELILK